MATDILSEMTTLGNSAYDSLKELAEINTKTAEKLSVQQLEILDSCLEAGTKQFMLATEAKGVKEVLSGQADLATEYNEKVLAFAKNTTAILTESKEELTAWLEKGVETAVSANAASKPAPAKKAPAKKPAAKKAPAKKPAAKKAAATEDAAA